MSPSLWLFPESYGSSLRRSLVHSFPSTAALLGSPRPLTLDRPPGPLAGGSLPRPPSPHGDGLLHLHGHSVAQGEPLDETCDLQSLTWVVNPREPLEDVSPGVGVGGGAGRLHSRPEPRVWAGLVGGVLVSPGASLPLPADSSALPEDLTML